MKTYRINIQDNNIVQDDGTLGGFFFSDDWRECTEEESTDFQIAELIKEKLAAREAYLNSTDWYIIRNTERSIEIPDDVRKNRDKAILEINIITRLNNIDDLENTTSNFEKTDS